MWVTVFLPLPVYHFKEIFDQIKNWHEMICSAAVPTKRTIYLQESPSTMYSNKTWFSSDFKKIGLSCTSKLHIQIGAALAERKRHMDLGKEGYVQIPIRVDDVRRWWNGDDFMGLHVEAFYKGENLAIHPQQDSKNVRLFYFFVSYEQE